MQRAKFSAGTSTLLCEKLGRTPRPKPCTSTMRSRLPSTLLSAGLSLRPTSKERAKPPAPSKGDGSRASVLALDNGGQTAKSTKNKNKRVKQKAQLAELRAVAKGAQKPGGKPKLLAIKDTDANKGKGKGKGKGKLKEKTDAGESICFNWAKGKDCHTTPCPHKHCCRICEGNHITADHGK